MAQHHPNENILAEYATGSLAAAQAVAVSTHLHYCPKCCANVQRMEQVAGVMLEQLEPQALAENSFDSLMNKIDLQDPALSLRSQPKPSSLPPLIARLIEKNALKWRKVTGALNAATLNAGENDFEVSLQKIKAGCKVPEHDHRGLEMTVVLKGSFSDQKGLYQAGDFLVKEPGDIHQPVSACNEDCLCLAVQQAPVKLTGILGKVINPFIRLQTAS